MSNPTVTCRSCGRSRDCLKHFGARRPVQQAKAWLWRHCPQTIDQCDIVYQAGIELPVPLTHQKDSLK